MSNEGYCQICGGFGPLTFEHIPPRRCLNSQSRRVVMLVDQLFSAQNGQPYGRRATKFRRGVGADTLCEKCNNTTGYMYGNAFAEWHSQALVTAQQLEDSQVAEVRVRIQPLEVIKQILVMGLAATSFAPGSHAWLRRFTCDPNRFSSIHPYYVYAYLNPTAEARLSGTSIKMNVVSGMQGFVLAESSLYPLGHVIVIAEEGQNYAGYDGLLDISHFSTFDPTTYRDFILKFPVRKPVGALPLTYRP